jgi:hypothetical protein
MFPSAEDPGAWQGDLFSCLTDSGLSIAILTGLHRIRTSGEISAKSLSSAFVCR